VAYKDTTDKIRKLAKDALESGKAEVVIGFAQGSLPGRYVPVFVTKPEDAGKLVWGPFAENNLARYLKDFSGKKIAVCAKGCDSRSIVALLKEGQLNRDDLFIIGVPCEGVVDRTRLPDPGRILSCEVGDGTLRVETPAGVEEFKISEILRANCAVCERHNPVIHDVMAAEPVEDTPNPERYAGLEEEEKKSPQERWAEFEKEASRCIRCYACREACPMCYCPTCFVENWQPRWIETGQDQTDLDIFQVVRCYHLAGRCSDCGACVSACPMNIDIRRLLSRIEKSVRDRFGHEVGISVDEPPPLNTFAEEDPLEQVV
jgi:ferredoxin